jgi:hypothetical protein
MYLSLNTAMYVSPASPDFVVFSDCRFIVLFHIFIIFVPVYLFYLT